MSKLWKHIIRTYFLFLPGNCFPSLNKASTFVSAKFLTEMFLSFKLNYILFGGAEELPILLHVCILNNPSLLVRPWLLLGLYFKDQEWRADHHVESNDQDSCFYCVNHFYIHISLVCWRPDYLSSLSYWHKPGNLFFSTAAMFHMFSLLLFIPFCKLFKLVKSFDVLGLDYLMFLTLRVFYLLAVDV